MSDLRQIVRERLKAAGSVGNHPDPDVLTAFAEQSLPVRERASVLEHVSRCTDCREVLALATPAREAAAAGTALSGSSRNWLRWPALRWGAAAACFVVVGAAVLLERNHKMDGYASLTPAAVKISDEMQIAEEKSAAISDLAMQKTVVPSPASPALAPERESKDQKTNAVKRITPPVNSADALKPSMKTEVVGGLATTREQAIAEANERAMSSNPGRDHADRKYEFSRQNAEVAAAPPAPTAVPAPAPPSPTAAGVGVAAGGSVGSTGAVGSVLAKKQVPGRAKASPMLDQDMNAPAPQAVGESKEVVEVMGLPVAAVPVNGRNVTSLVPRWTISADGQLQRSLDSGKTWEIVPVADGSSSMNLVSAEATANYQKGMRAPSDKAKARVESPSEQNQPKFRTLSANGNDVWVGGTAGLLYHSADAGMHWTRVKAVANGATLTADIVTLDFADAQHGRVVVSTGETWVTIDGGKNWKKQ